MKTILATLILTELALAFLLVVFVFGHFDSPSLARAWDEKRRNPSPETEAAFNKKKSATDRMIFALNAGVGCCWQSTVTPCSRPSERLRLETRRKQNQGPFRSFKRNA